MASLVALRRKYLDRWTIVALCLGLLIGGDIFLGAQLKSNISVNCGRINVVVISIKGTVKRAETLLGTPGSSGYAYYQEHPDELARTQVELKREYNSFMLLKC